MSPSPQGGGIRVHPAVLALWVHPLPWNVDFVPRVAVGEMPSHVPRRGRLSNAAVNGVVILPRRWRRGTVDCPLAPRRAKILLSHHGGLMHIVLGLQVALEGGGP